MGFEEVLSKNLDGIEAPKPLPVGNYLLKVGKQIFGESKEKHTPYCRYEMEVLEPKSGVDLEALSMVGNYKAKKLRVDFWLTEDAIHRLKKFLEACGLSIKGKSVKQAIPEACGQTVIGNMTQRPNERDPDTVYNDVAAFAKVS